MTSPDLAPSRARDRLLTVTGGLLLATMIALLLVDLQSLPAALGCAYQKAIFCAEFPTSGANLDAILTSPPNTVGQWQLAVWLDMGFLVFYGALLALSAGAIGGNRSLVRATAFAAVLGALLDIAENIGILMASAPAPASDGLAAFTALSAGAKFTALGLACAGLATLAFTGRRGRPWLAAALGVGGAIALGAGLLGWVDTRAFELGALGIAITCLGLWVRAAVALTRRI